MVVLVYRKTSRHEVYERRMYVRVSHTCVVKFVFIKLGNKRKYIVHDSAGNWSVS